jgi:hypothetical protein
MSKAFQMLLDTIVRDASQMQLRRASVALNYYLILYFGYLVASLSRTRVSSSREPKLTRAKTGARFANQKAGAINEGTEPF